jgi:hypothetical protein
LARLKKLSSNLGPGLIWLDTLCCPVGPPDAKQLALEKLPNPYIHASHVLVLDNSLTSVSSKPLHPIEKTARILTSGWMRRLWTLQEAALPKSLWFRYLDEVVSIDSLKEALSELWQNQYYYRGIINDFNSQFRILISFHHARLLGLEGFTRPRLEDLDAALLYRAASKRSDEALCIATLMEISLDQILAVEPSLNEQEKGVYKNELPIEIESVPLLDGKHTEVEVKKEGTTKSGVWTLSRDELRESVDGKLHVARMQKMWELLAQSRGGLPVDIIFLQEPRLPTPGWRWAPYSLLDRYHGLGYPAGARRVRWASSQLVSPTERGLRVQLPGLLLKAVTYDDNIPQQPWKGVLRIPLHSIIVRVSKLEWYRIIEKPSPPRQGASFDKATTDMPLEDLARVGIHAIIMAKEIPADASTGTACDGILSSISMTRTTDTGTTPGNRNEEIVVITQRQVLVVRMSAEEVKLLEIIENLASKLRRGSLTKELLLISEEGGEENNQTRKDIIDMLKQEMKKEMNDVREKTPGLDNIIRKSFGNIEEKSWVFIADWFYRDMAGIKYSSDQIWYVD